jgi:arginine:ornithine antiporter/lysine permease
LITTNVAVQALLLSVLVVRDALDFILALDTALSLVPYLFVAGYALKLTITREIYGAADESERRRQQVIAAVAVVYSIFLLYAAGLKYLLVACIVYAPGTLLYIWARRKQGMRVFQPAEAVICVALIVAGSESFSSPPATWRSDQPPAKCWRPAAFGQPPTSSSRPSTRPTGPSRS